MPITVITSSGHSVFAFCFIITIIIINAFFPSFFFSIRSEKQLEMTNGRENASSYALDIGETGESFGGFFSEADNGKFYTTIKYVAARGA